MKLQVRNHRRALSASALVLLAAVLAAVPGTPRASSKGTETGARPTRLALASDAARLKAIEFADPLGGAHAPNYIRLLAEHTEAAPHFAHLTRTVLYGGALPPETKMAMGQRVARVLGTPYALAHAERWLRASERGRAMLTGLRGKQASGLTPAEQLAVDYADKLTRDANGITDADFARVRAHYNDSQIVELTMTTCFFNYFARLCEASSLPVEAWTTEAVPTAVPAFHAPRARIGLISDEEMAATATLTAAAREPQRANAGLGLGIANSQRAMLRAPALAAAWRAYGAAVRERATIDRALQLHVSFAVSMANGCRYCTLHQVLGLRRLGVDPAKLVRMRKDDSALSPRELAAVSFARLLTTSPAAVTDANFDKLRAEFGDRGALEVVLQTCAFNFMNRFTDTLGLPSEDEAVRTYREVYGDAHP
ncbi:MAG TPA: carboxymuconolactone decarboxylase family protein [Pyrinomonadaceae bacterium]|jgi:AhpD family alkylhydroperoxidase